MTSEQLIEKLERTAMAQCAQETATPIALSPGDVLLLCRLARAGAATMDAAQAEEDGDDGIDPHGIGTLPYRGNSVAYWVTRAEARGGAIDEAWKALSEAGYPPDGETSLEDMIRRLAAQPVGEVDEAMVIRLGQAFADAASAEDRHPATAFGLDNIERWMRAALTAARLPAGAGP